MARRYILLLVIVTIAACNNKQTLDKVVHAKIEVFEKHESKHFARLNIRDLHGKSRRGRIREYQVTREGQRSYAIVQTYPEALILKGFWRDSLAPDFPQALAELGIRDLKTDGSNVHMLFDYGSSSNMLLVRGDVDSRYKYRDTLVIYGLNEWKCFVLD